MKTIRNIGTTIIGARPHGIIRPGAVGAVDDDLAARLVEAGVAEIVEPVEQAAGD